MSNITRSAMQTFPLKIKSRITMIDIFQLYVITCVEIRFTGRCVWHSASDRFVITCICLLHLAFTTGSIIDKLFFSFSDIARLAERQRRQNVNLSSHTYIMCQSYDSNAVLILSCVWERRWNHGLYQCNSLIIDTWWPYSRVVLLCCPSAELYHCRLACLCKATDDTEECCKVRN